MPNHSSPVPALTEEELQNVFRFIGYGNLKGPVWFLGMEEGGGSNERLRIQSHFDSVEDLRDAHINKLGITRHHSGTFALQRTWNAMCHIMLSLNGTEPNVPNRKRYQANHLGTMDGDTLLAELMPVAKPSIGSWQTDTLLHMFKNRHHYYEQVMPGRISMLEELVKKYEPQLIVAYGRSYREHYQKVLDKAVFQDHGRMRHGTWGNTTMILTDHFAARTMNKATPDVIGLITQLLPDLSAQLTARSLQGFLDIPAR